MLKYAEGHHEQGLGAFDKSQKATITSAMPAFTSAAPTGRIDVKFGMGTFMKFC
jgi:hypothetical protein